MFYSNKRSTQLSCGFKVNTNSPSWHKSMTRILKRITGGNFELDADEGMAYVSGHGDPNKLLKLMGSKQGQGAEMKYVKTNGHYHQQQHHHHHYHPLDHQLSVYHNNYHYNSPYPQSQSYWPRDNVYSSYSPQYLPYYPQSHAIQPYYPQYSYPRYNNYGYY